MTKNIPHTGDTESLDVDSSTNIFFPAGVKKGADSIFFGRKNIIVKGA